MFQIKPEAVFKLEQLLWKLVGWWPGSARRRLWLPHPVVEVRPAKHFLTIFVIVRNEAPYIDEWIEFHRMMGVSHFFIYDNGSSDDTVDRLSSYVDAGLVTVVRWADFLKGWEGVAGTGGRIQKLGMLHCLANFGHLTEWMAFIDTDEFLFPTAENSLTDVLREYEDLDSLSVYWHMGASKNTHTRALIG